MRDRNLTIRLLLITKKSIYFKENLEFTMEAKEIIIFETDSGSISINVQLSAETLWLSLNEISALFERDKSVISRHLRNIFNEQELKENEAVAKFATVQDEGNKRVRREIEYYNLDAILSVGYRVNSKRGTQFRRWASQVLNNYLLQGYAINQNQLNEKKIAELKETITLLSNTLMNQELVDDIGINVLAIIKEYAKTWDILLKYDEDNLELAAVTHTRKLKALKYKDVKKAIETLKSELIPLGAASELFGRERDHALESILNNIEQTFAKQPVYPSNQLRAAHLLYFCNGSAQITVSK
jgi:prophage antirepressor-like protein